VIKQVRLRHFKQFDDQVIDLTDSVVLAGPNNSGKTTLLQAIAVWNLALQKWLAKRGRSTAKQRTGVGITRQDFTAIPLREMNLLWYNTSTALRRDELAEGQRLGHPRAMVICLRGTSAGRDWEVAFEFTYQNSEMLSVRPASDHRDLLPDLADEFQVVHVPPFSGIGAEETRYERPYQDLLIGQGKAGDIVRNLLVEVFQHQDKSRWNDLAGQVDSIFGYRLLPPVFEGKPYILCEYLRGQPQGKGRNGLPQLDIASAGSGFHQVLLLLGFIYARPASVLLLDEPDAHLHVIPQKQIYDRMRSVAATRGSQLIVATHSEVLTDATSPERIVSFCGPPHSLAKDVDRDQLREAMKCLTAMDLLLAEPSAGVVYVEGESDFNLLRAWATVLDHPVAAWFKENPFYHSNHGRNPREAKNHFFALRAVRPTMRGLLLLDGDNRGLPDREMLTEGLSLERWKRYEAESYLVHPEALGRFVRAAADPLFANAALDVLKDELPGATIRNPLGDSDYLDATPVSKSLLPSFFAAANLSLPKNEYYRIAEQMTEGEIAPEVRDKLDAIYSVVGPLS
jgi:ABC-type nitrate/sulfonate/bicarbonate transport system ATPase subunit